MVGKEEEPLGDAVYTGSIATDPECYADLYENIILGGGSSMFPGIASRLYQDLITLVSEKREINNIFPPKTR